MIEEGKKDYVPKKLSQRYADNLLEVTVNLSKTKQKTSDSARNSHECGMKPSLRIA